MEKEKIIKQLHLTQVEGNKVQFTEVMNKIEREKRKNELFSLASSSSLDSEMKAYVKELSAINAGEFEAIKKTEIFEFEIPYTLEEMIECEEKKGSMHMCDYCFIYNHLSGPRVKHDFRGVALFVETKVGLPELIIKEQDELNLWCDKLTFPTGILMGIRKIRKLEAEWEVGKSLPTEEFSFTLFL